MTTSHAAGTIDMMRATVEGLTLPDGTRPMLAVTALTSTSEERMQRELPIQSQHA